METELQEAKIRNAIWYLKVNKTKKFVCDYLGIPYNVKKLDTVISEFKSRQAKLSELKEKARKKVFSEAEKQFIAKEYMSGTTLTALAEQYHISVYRLRKILVELQIPIKSNKATDIKHLSITTHKLYKNTKVFYKKYNCYCVVEQRYDEELVDWLLNSPEEKVETYPFTLKSKFKYPQLGIHYEYYVSIPGLGFIKKVAAENLASTISNNLADYGEEYYKVWREDEEKCFYFAKRSDLFPI